jgi:hypothetical protein
VYVAAGTASTGSTTVVDVPDEASRLGQGRTWRSHRTTTGSRLREHGSRRPRQPDGDCTVYFSDAGAPETFGASNFVGLWPGDGEPITALVRGGTGCSRSSRRSSRCSRARAPTARKPDLQLLRRDAGQGANAGAVVVGDDGLYFANNSGVYVTTGQAPVYLSRALEPWIRAGRFTGLPSLSMANLTLAYFAKRPVRDGPDEPDDARVRHGPADVERVELWARRRGLLCPRRHR